MKKKLTVKDALLEFVDFCSDYRIAKWWAKPSRFDFTILEHAFHTEGIADKIPWAKEHYNVLDVRTVHYFRNQEEPFRKIEYETKQRQAVNDLIKGFDTLPIEHHPVYDCLLQIYDLVYCKKLLEKKGQGKNSQVAEKGKKIVVSFEILDQ